MTLSEIGQSTAGRVVIGFALFAAGYYFPPWEAFTRADAVAPTAASATAARPVASSPSR
jgi:hypothetical protein